MQIYRKNLRKDGAMSNAPWRRIFNMKVNAIGYSLEGKAHASITVDTDDAQRLDLCFTHEEVERMFAIFFQSLLEARTW